MEKPLPELDQLRKSLGMIEKEKVVLGNSCLIIL